MSAEKSRSPWVWIFLFLMLGLFAAFIVYLDQRIVSSSHTTDKAEQSDVDRTKPKIDFYKVLPDRKVEIPISEKDQEGIRNPSINKTSGDQVLLQVGSFQKAGEAESLKAGLAFLGLEASVKSAVVNSGTWHRVQVGPFASNSDLSRAKNLLLENNIKYMQRSLPQ
ncbi:MAG: hypothetical protein GY820_23430 [Gammaproteobacteria bacterium]|nr:hypothetical protein [Gammaproteobacteria bacterium]